MNTKIAAALVAMLCGQPFGNALRSSQSTDGSQVAAPDEVVPSTTRVLSSVNVPYTFVHAPPVYNSITYSQTNLQSPCCNSVWISPDRHESHGHQYADGGDPTFYFVIDLGSSFLIDKLRVRQKLNHIGIYCTKDYEVSVSASAQMWWVIDHEMDSQVGGYGTPITGSLFIDGAFTQDITIGQSGRYIRFKALTYCQYGAGLCSLEVLTDGQTGSAACPDDVPAPSPPTKSPSLVPTGSPSNSPTGSPSNSPTGSPTNAPTGPQGPSSSGTTGGTAAVPSTTSGAAASSSASDSFYYPDWSKSNGGCKTGGGQPLYMTLAYSTWMFATLDDCCARYYSWMLNECKGTSVAAPSGLWYPDWAGSDDTCKNDGGEPEYMVLNSGAWMHSSKQECCEANFSWMLYGCLGSSDPDAGATNQWYMVWDAQFKCKQDCVGTGPSCGGRANSWDQLFETRSACCADKAAWNPEGCLVD